MSGPTSTDLLVRGEIVFDDAVPFNGATLYVLLEDTSLADADAVEILRLVKKNISYDPGTESKLTFELHGKIPDDHKLYTISVLVDLDGDGRISRDDYINTESYPVLTRGHPREVSVHVKRVK